MDLLNPDAPKLKYFNYFFQDTNHLQECLHMADLEILKADHGKKEQALSRIISAATSHSDLLLPNTCCIKKASAMLHMSNPCTQHPPYPTAGSASNCQ